MSPVFVLLPGLARWEVVDVRGVAPAQPLISGPLVSEPVAATEPDGRTPSIQNREPRT